MVNVVRYIYHKPIEFSTFRQLNARELDGGPPANAIGPRKTGTGDGPQIYPFMGGINHQKPSECGFQHHQ